MSKLVLIAWNDGAENIKLVVQLHQPVTKEFYLSQVKRLLKDYDRLEVKGKLETIQIR